MPSSDDENMKTMRRIAEALTFDDVPKAWPADPPAPENGEPLYGACEYARSVLRPPLPWGALGTLAIQGFRDGRSYVYFIGSDHGPVKIGTSVAPLERITSMQMGSPYVLRFCALIEGGRETEAEYHQRFAKHRVRGEWFERVPEIEAEIARLCAQASEPSERGK